MLATIHSTTSQEGQTTYYQDEQLNTANNQEASNTIKLSDGIEIDEQTLQSMFKEFLLEQLATYEEIEEEEQTYNQVQPQQYKSEETYYRQVSQDDERKEFSQQPKSQEQSYSRSYQYQNQEEEEEVVTQQEEYSYQNSNEDYYLQSQQEERIPYAQYYQEELNSIESLEENQDNYDINDQQESNVFQGVTLQNQDNQQQEQYEYSQYYENQEEDENPEIESEEETESKQDLPFNQLATYRKQKQVKQVTTKKLNKEADVAPAATVGDKVSYLLDNYEAEVTVNDDVVSKLNEEVFNFIEILPQELTSQIGEFLAQSIEVTIDDQNVFETKKCGPPSLRSASEILDRLQTNTQEEVVIVEEKPKDVCVIKEKPPALGTKDEIFGELFKQKQIEEEFLKMIEEEQEEEPQVCIIKEKPPTLLSKFDIMKDLDFGDDEECEEEWEEEEGIFKQRPPSARSKQDIEKDHESKKVTLEFSEEEPEKEVCVIKERPPSLGTKLEFQEDIKKDELVYVEEKVEEEEDIACLNKDIFKNVLDDFDPTSIDFWEELVKLEKRPLPYNQVEED